MSEVDHREGTRRAAWSVLVAVAAGALAGAIVGGVGGRLAMLLLRLTSPETVNGMTTDDGFEIGVFTTDTLNLVAGMTMLGGINGVLYAVLRRGIPKPIATAALDAVRGGARRRDDRPRRRCRFHRSRALAARDRALRPAAGSRERRRRHSCRALGDRPAVRVAAADDRSRRLCPRGDVRRSFPPRLRSSCLLVIEQVDAGRMVSRLSTLVVTGALVVVCLLSVVDLVATSRRIL